MSSMTLDICFIKSVFDVHVTIPYRQANAERDAAIAEAIKAMDALALDKAC